MPYSLIEVQRYFGGSFHLIGYFVGLFFHPENGDSMLL
jgi:hypothetical protein